MQSSLRQISRLTMEAYMHGVNRTYRKQRMEDIKSTLTAIISCDSSQLAGHQGCSRQDNEKQCMLSLHMASSWCDLTEQANRCIPCLFYSLTDAMRYSIHSS